MLVPVARGWTNHEIADDLHISVSTVKTHLAALMRKLGARNRRVGRAPGCRAPA